MNNSLDTENQIRLDGILASVKDAVIAMDEGQHIVLFNPAAELMFGRLAGEAMGTRSRNSSPWRVEMATTVSSAAFARPGWLIRWRRP